MADASIAAQARLVRFLLDAGASEVLLRSVLAKKNRSVNILMRVIRSIGHHPSHFENYAIIIEMLVKAGADVNYTNIYAVSVLQIALGRRAPLVIVSTLVELGADLTLMDKERDMVHLAPIYGDNETLQYIVEQTQRRWPKSPWTKVQFPSGKGAARGYTGKFVMSSNNRRPLIARTVMAIPPSCVLSLTKIYLWLQS